MDTPVFYGILGGVLLLLLILFLSRKGRKKSGKSAKPRERSPLPFENTYAYPYVERPFDEKITEYLEGEQLYMSGKRGKAKLIWGRLAKAGNIDANAAMIAYFLDQNQPENALKYKEGATRHGYAAFNVALIYYRSMFISFEVSEMGFSFESDDEKYRKYKVLDYMYYFRIAAMQDVPEAQYNLAHIYRYGLHHENEEKNLYLALYWYYRGAMRAHGPSIRGLCEVYRELLPVCDEYVAAKFTAAIAALEKWMAQNPDKLGNGKMILRHFDPTHHEKHKPFDEQESFRDFVRQAVRLTEHSVTDEGNTFAFDRYALSLDFSPALDAWDRIPSFFPKLVFKGKGNVTYGTYFTKTKEDGVRGLRWRVEDKFVDKLRVAALRNPYCVLAFEKECNSLRSQGELTKYRLTRFLLLGITVSVDEKGIASEKYVYIPPKKEPEPTYVAPPSYDSGSSFSYASLFFSEGETSYSVTTDSGTTSLTRDVSNPNIFFDAAGNKYYSSDNGNSVTKW